MPHGSSRLWRHALRIQQFDYLMPDDLDAVATAFDAAETTAGDLRAVDPNERNQAPSKGGLTRVAGAGFEPA